MFIVDPCSMCGAAARAMLLLPMESAFARRLLCPLLATGGTLALPRKTLLSTTIHRCPSSERLKRTRQRHKMAQLVVNKKPGCPGKRNAMLVSPALQRIETDHLFRC
jgi:hypothetical protein